MSFSYDACMESVSFLLSKTRYRPKLAIILGSGLGPLAEAIEDADVISYEDIPHFLRSTAPDHAGKMIFGTLGGKEIVCMSGRFHSYEGYSFEQLVVPVRVLRGLGVNTLILTNAAGGVNREYRVGDIVVLKDHIKMTGDSPLRGKNDERFGPRFFDVSRLYTPQLRRLALDAAVGSGLHFHEGVYFFMTGPQFETPAEVRAIGILGGDVVGMSTVTEALTAAHCGMKVLAFSVVTNMAAGISESKLSSQEVNETGAAVAKRFSTYMTELIKKL